MSRYEMSQDNKEFEYFVITVTPAGQVQKVWLAEAIAILKLLWEIYQLLKDKGCFARRVAVSRTKKAMAFDSEYDKTVALEKVIEKLS